MKLHHVTDSATRRALVLALATIGWATMIAGTAFSSHALAEELSPQKTFPSSLHATRTGKAYFYDAAQGGFERLTGVPMQKLQCLHCHAPAYADGTKIDAKTYEPGCRDCHAGEPKTGDTVPDKVCLGCHSRQKVEAKMTRDVHRAKGMGCMDCHTTREMHGDGKRYASMLEPGAMDASCVNCHPVDTLAKNTAHRRHQETVDCKACHSRSVIACNNCHFESEMAGGGKRFKKPPFKDFAFLVRRQGSGKVHPATMQSLVYGDSSFVVIAPFGSHSVSAKARACKDCHASKALREYAGKGRITVTRWSEKSGKVKGPNGIVPIPGDWRDALRFDFVTYTGDPSIKKTDPKAWKLLKRGADGLQMLFAEPLSDAQIKALRTQGR